MLRFLVSLVSSQTSLPYRLAVLILANFGRNALEHFLYIRDHILQQRISYGTRSG